MHIVEAVASGLVAGFALGVWLSRPLLNDLHKAVNDVRALLGEVKSGLEKAVKKL